MSAPADRAQGPAPLAEAAARRRCLAQPLSAGHQAACLRYAEAKRANAGRWSDDGWAYTDAKTGIMLDILEHAEDWATATEWAP